MTFVLYKLSIEILAKRHFFPLDQGLAEIKGEIKIFRFRETYMQSATTQPSCGSMKAVIDKNRCLARLDLYAI